MKQELNSKLPTCWLVYSLYQQGVCRLLGHKSHQQPHSAVEGLHYSVYLPAIYARRCNSGMTILGVTNHFLLGLEACSMIVNAWLIL